jgi:hypothetical protein
MLRVTLPDTKQDQTTANTMVGLQYIRRSHLSNFMLIGQELSLIDF